MITFLNFAPIEYLGGAERMMLKLYKLVSKGENAKLLTADFGLANSYAKIAIGQSFNSRITNKLNVKEGDYIKLSLSDFFPFTQRWFEIRKTLKSSRLIYLKMELNEIIILCYFGGFFIFKKTVAAILSPWTYTSPNTFIEKLHNNTYQSTAMKRLLNKFKSIQVLTPQDEEVFTHQFRLKNIRLIPNDTSMPTLQQVKRNANELRIIFVGELIARKGISVLLDVIKASPKEFQFDVVGDGILKDSVIELTKEVSNCTYHGYVDNKKDLLKLLNKADVFFFPSRAEGFAGVILEAMSVGLNLVVSPSVYNNLPPYIEDAPSESLPTEYIEIFKRLHNLKRKNSLDRLKIIQFCATNFSSESVARKYQKLFS